MEYKYFFGKLRTMASYTKTKQNVCSSLCHYLILILSYQIKTNADSNQLVALPANANDNWLDVLTYYFQF